MALADRIDRLQGNLDLRFSRMLGDDAGPTGERFSDMLDRAPTGQKFSDMLAAPGASGPTWAGMRGSQPAGQRFGDMLGGGGNWGDPLNFSGWDLFNQAHQRRLAGDAAEKAANAGTPGVSNAGKGEPGGVAGEGFGAPTPEQIEAQLGGRGVRNPALTAAGVQQYANQYGVPVALVLAIANQESGYGTDKNQATDANNFFGLTGDGDRGHVTIVTPEGRSIDFAKFSTADKGLAAAVRNMAAGNYQGLTLRQYLALYLTGDVNGRDDGSGNKTDSYVANAEAIIRNLGGNATGQSVAVRPRAAGGPATGGQQLTGGMAGIWGGGPASVNQDFGAVTPGIDQGIYEYGRTDFGTNGGHTGLDIGVARGTNLYAPGAGVVVNAGGTGYFKDEDYGDPGNALGRGELKIRMDDGTEVILGHNSYIGVGIGERVSAGQLVGRSGSASGDHLHLEVRVPDASQRSGYRIVDPRTYFGAQAPAGTATGGGRQ